MDIGFVRGLGVPDRREAVADALVALGGDALTDRDSPVPWRPVADVLERIGESGFDELIQALVSASDESSRKHIALAFSHLGPAFLGRYTTALSHPVPLVRREAVLGIRYCGEAGRSAAAALLPLLGDPDREVARQAQDTLISQGPQVIPLLQRIREAGPGAQRARALTALAELGGEPALSAADAAAIERLIRVKLPGDRPEGMWGCWNHWIAVPSGEQTGIMRALGVVDPRPVTFALGNDIVDADGHRRGDDEDPHTGYERVFVTPELDGWTLVLGAWCDPCGEERRDDVLRLCTELSARYGQAQAYYSVPPG